MTWKHNRAGKLGSGGLVFRYRRLGTNIYPNTSFEVFLYTSNIARAMHVSRHPKNCLPSQHVFIKIKERLVLLNMSDHGAGSKEFEAPLTGLANFLKEFEQMDYAWLLLISIHIRNA
jgi:hypothetical protein